MNYNGKYRYFINSFILNYRYYIILRHFNEIFGNFLFSVIVGVVGIVLVLWTTIGYYRSVFYYTSFSNPPPVRNKFYFQKQLNNGISTRLMNNNQKMKYILYYTKFFESEDWYIG